VNYSCPSCQRDLRFRLLGVTSPLKGFLRGLVENTEKNAYGFCPFCAASLKRNIHEAEARTGRVIFPALIFATVCVVVFVYLLYEWLLFLGFGVVIIALFLEHLVITRRIPEIWPRWQIADKQLVTAETANLHLVLGGLWLAVMAAAVVTQWPKWHWFYILGFLAGIGWIALGVVEKRLITKTRNSGY